MKSMSVEERRLTTADGTEIAYHRVGNGLPILLCNGLGGSWRAWSHQIAHFEDRYHFLSWDYRGLYRSGRPPTIPGDAGRSDKPAVSVRDSARDGLEVMDREGIEQVALFGWSMGVQVALEMFRLAPDRVAALMLMNGVAGNPWNSVLNVSFLSGLMPKVIRTIGAMPRVAEAVTRRVVRWPETIPWVQRVGLAASTLDESIFHDLAESFVDLDMALYMRTLESLGEHDAFPFLGQIDVPTLVITGDRDLLTPRRAAEAIVRAVPGAELMVVPGGTHYTAIEYPELVNL